MSHTDQICMTHTNLGVSTGWGNKVISSFSSISPTISSTDAAVDLATSGSSNAPRISIDVGRGEGGEDFEGRREEREEEWGSKIFGLEIAFKWECSISDTWMRSIVWTGFWTGFLFWRWWRITAIKHTINTFFGSIIGHSGVKLGQILLQPNGDFQILYPEKVS